MSLGIAFKGPEGIVIAADSRVTLTGTMPSGQTVQSSYDNATKLLKVKGQDFVGVVTYGAGSIGSMEPRTAHSFLPEFESELHAAGESRLSVEEFSSRLSTFFVARWNAGGMPAAADPMVFLIAGFDEGSVYGKVFQVVVPASPTPVEQTVDVFGLTFGGQVELVQRMLGGYDPRAVEVAQSALGLDAAQAATLRTALTQQLGLAIPYQFLPLQDCVDLVIFLVRSTVMVHKWLVGTRGVGGAIDVATITRTEGFQAIQTKSIRGE
jgi:hypothetical protein